MQIYRSPFFSFSIDTLLSVFEMSCFNVTKVTEDIYKEEMLNYIELLEKYSPNYLLINIQEGEFIVSITLQEWMNKNIIPRSAPIIKKTALVVHSSFIMQLSLQQTFEDDPIHRTTRQFFDNVLEAKNWLLEEDF